MILTKELRKELHNNQEKSMHETKTKQVTMLLPVPTDVQGISAVMTVTAQYQDEYGNSENGRLV